MYWAHLEGEKSQRLEEHLKNVAQLGKEFSIDELKSYVYLAGLLHDIGKYSDKFQARIRGEKVTVEHAISGAKEVGKVVGNNIVAILLCYCILGHHTGLCDGGTKVDSQEMPTMWGRLKRKTEDYAYYHKEIELSNKVDLEPLKEYMRKRIHAKDKKEYNVECIELFSFITRYIFSCLTDADYLDTEKFCNNRIDRYLVADFIKGKKTLEEHMHRFIIETTLQNARQQLQKQALDYVEEKGLAPISILNMPTGSGKTLCSLQLALKEIEQSKGALKRIIYVIPYTSIIEQTAQIFESILGDDVPIIQHRSDMIYDKEESESPTTVEKLKHACENWDAPMIITTNIQFFESIYHFKGSKLRKLHNMQDSIIILDEVHMMPIPYLKPCLEALRFLTECLNSKVILMSATMPNIKNYFTNAIRVEELIKDKSKFNLFATCTFSWLGDISHEKLVSCYENKSSILVIVNTKQRALTLYNECPKDNKYYLTTLLTSEDRSRIIEQIKRDLKQHRETFVFSTSLVEAGVDLDFESVFRELSGIDNILQAAGRCNREGVLKNAVTYIFTLEGEYSAKKDLLTRAMTTKGILEEKTTLYDPEVITQYYNRLFETIIEDKEKASIATCSGGNSQLDGIPFRIYANNFKLIDVTTIDVAILLDEDKVKLYKQAQFGERLARRKLRKYCISLYLYEFDKLKQIGVVDDEGSGIYYLTNNDYYNEKTGLMLNKESVAYFDW